MGGAENGHRFYDNVTGRPLETQRVLEARAEEIKYYKDKTIYIKVPRAKCFEKTGKAPIRVRWVDVNKGDENEPNYRSRLVAMEFKKDVNTEWFSGTPPLEALRALCSTWASQEEEGKIERARGRSEEEDICMLVIDVKKAHLCAPAVRDVL